MTKSVKDIIEQEEFTKDDLTAMLKAEGDDQQILFAKAHEIKKKYVGLRTYYRGLVEFSNYCYKNCYYCGIRSGTSMLKDMI